jgi:heme exporter protein B
MPSWPRQALIVFVKDMRIEARTGEVVTTSTFFAILVVVMSSLAFHVGPSSGRSVAAGTIWLTVAFSAILALSKSWQREREDSAFVTLLVAGIARSALFFGKFLGLVAFLGVVLAVVVPLVAVLFAVDLLPHLGGLCLLALLAIPGIAAASTLFGVMTIRTRARDLVLSIVLFPLLAPVLLTTVVATRELFSGLGPGELKDYFLLLGVFDTIYLAGGLSLFGLLVEQ